MKNRHRIWIYLLAWVTGTVAIADAAARPPGTWTSSLYGEDWSPLPALTFESDKLIQDFSYAGYAKGERPIPSLDGARILNVLAFGADPLGQMDSTAAIQDALDTASAIRGGAVVYMPEGTYLVSPAKDRGRCLLINNDNIVLRGAGIGKTFLLNTSTKMRGKQIILVAAPASAAWNSPDSAEVPIREDLMSPTLQVPVRSTEGFCVGDQIVICCDPTEAWILDHKEPEWLGAEKKLGHFFYYRQIKAINPEQNMLTIDVPTRYTLKRSYNARVYLKKGMIREVGLEEFSIGNVEHPGRDGFRNLDFAAPTGEYTQRLIADAGLTAEEAAVVKSAYDIHFSFAIAMVGVADGWIKNVASFHPPENRTGCHILSNGIRLKECANVSLVNCSMQKTQYGGGGGNGYMFRMDGCNECLFESCTAAYARHGFSMSGMACSGNVFYKCFDKEAGHQTGATGDEETDGKSSDHHMWFSHSNLYDGCIADNSWFEARDRYYPVMSKPKHNTTSAHTVIWNTEGRANRYHPFVVWSLQGKYGYVIGTKGAVSAVRTDGDYPEKRKSISDPVDHVEGVGMGDTLRPASLFEDQRRRRLGR